MNLIDTILLKAIVDDNGRNFTRTKADSYKEYYRQYVCFVKENGDSIVYINALCKIFEGPIHDDNDSLRWVRLDWQHHLIEVDDGGPCFWRIWINVTKREYFNFMVNGVA
jgi:hypothetical protein